MSAVLAEPTWHERELPFLAEALRQLEAGEVDEPGITAIAEGACLTERDGLLAARALGEDGFIRMRWIPRGAGPPEHGMVRAVGGDRHHLLGVGGGIGERFGDRLGDLFSSVDAAWETTTMTA